MAQIIVRKLDEDIKLALQRRARAHGRSTEEEVREILRDAVRLDRGAPVRLGTVIASRFRGTGLPSEISELRGHPIQVPELG